MYVCAPCIVCTHTQMYVCAPCVICTHTNVCWTCKNLESCNYYLVRAYKLESLYMRVWHVELWLHQLRKVYNLFVALGFTATPVKDFISLFSDAKYACMCIFVDVARTYCTRETIGLKTSFGCVWKWKRGNHYFLQVCMCMCVLFVQCW